ncbi:hypothetical protein C8R47DRAFT_1273299 [Mycena vitilis]|nr:hypothetical protein C8R47DRAFT_1273299 [Mycena vitilis]
MYPNSPLAHHPFGLTFRIISPRITSDCRLADALCRHIAAAQASTLIRITHPHIRIAYLYFTLSIIITSLGSFVGFSGRLSRHPSRELALRVGCSGFPPHEAQVSTASRVWARFPGQTRSPARFPCASQPAESAAKRPIPPHTHSISHIIYSSSHIEWSKTTVSLSPPSSLTQAKIDISLIVSTASRVWARFPGQTRSPARFPCASQPAESAAKRPIPPHTHPISHIIYSSSHIEWSKTTVSLSPPSSLTQAKIDISLIGLSDDIPQIAVGDQSPDIRATSLKIGGV